LFNLIKGQKGELMNIQKLVVFALLSFSVAACQQGDIKKADLKTQKDKVSYSIGLDIGKTMKRQSIEVEPKALLQGIKDALAKDSLYLLTDAEIQEVMTNWQKDMMAKQTAKMKEEGDKNKKEGEAFLAQNKTKSGVKTTASGLQYKVITAGNGATPKPEDKVKCNYRGTLLNGTEFDNSYKRGEPIVFPVKGVIKGWTEALQMMKVGDKWHGPYRTRCGRAVPGSSIEQAFCRRTIYSCSFRRRPGPGSVQSRHCSAGRTRRCGPQRRPFPQDPQFWAHFRARTRKSYTLQAVQARRGGRPRHSLRRGTVENT
jgi:FKBP-type peptidyl-prolyl cis-trans isomerase FklB